jgi:glyoxylase-like metal-dependent hydrolase (beta-lactamase superfamily II)
LVVKQAGDVKIHTFISSFVENNIANATHIVESAHKLVLVDAQFLAPYARSFRAYADSLGKPIDRLYISHRHPDHWFGLAAAFRDVPSFGLPETVEFIKAHGEESRADHWKLGSYVPESIVVPDGTVEPGEETIDAITYLFDRVTETEIDYHLTVKLPEFGVHFTQDLVYSGTHLYLSEDLRHWSQVLGEMLKEEYELFMPGHGFPADKTEVARNIEYLEAAGVAIAAGMTGTAFKEFMLARYPERRCPGIFDIYLPRLFGGAPSY